MLTGKEPMERDRLTTNLANQMVDVLQRAQTSRMRPFECAWACFAAARMVQRKSSITEELLATIWEDTRRCLTVDLVGVDSQEVGQC